MLITKRWWWNYVEDVGDDRGYNDDIDDEAVMKRSIIGEQQLRVTQPAGVDALALLDPRHNIILMIFGSFSLVYFISSFSVMIIQQHFPFLRDSHLETVQNDKRGWHFAIKLSSKVRTWEANISWILLLKSLLQYRKITWWLCLCWLWWWRRWRWLYLPSCVCTAKAPPGSPEKLRSRAAAIFQNSHNDPFWKRSISGERAS